MTTTTTTAWTTWCGSPTSFTTGITGATASSVIWDEWCGTGITSATTNTGDTWIVWASEATSNSVMIQNRDFSEEQQKAIDERNEANRIAALKHAEQQKERKAKAIKLLRDTLDRKQKKDLNKRKHFFVRGGKSGNLYKIKQGRVQNVELVDDRKRTKQRLCAHPQINCPDEDTMLVQKVMIEHMEDHFRDIANITYH